MIESNLRESLLSCSTLIQERISDILPKNFNDSNLVKAMRYSSLSGGKRIRPFLLMSCAEIFSAPLDSTIDIAVAVEFIHTYSLIHDDLPAMDDDDVRRGYPANHKKFDEATAILAGDALLTLAFEILSNPRTHKNANIRCDLILSLAKSAGYKGMVGGQMIDLESANKKINKEQIANLHRQKTGELFIASCEMGAILGGASHQDRNRLKYYAHDIGLAFQIKDDLLDHQEDSQQKNEDNTSIVNVVGVQRAKKQLEMLRDQAIEHIKPFGKKANTLIELANFVVIREE